MQSSVPSSIPGDLVPHEDAEFLRKDVAALLERDNIRFPGAQPVSFARKHISELQIHEYFMYEKTDGIRCLLFLHFFRDEHDNYFPVTLLIDRKNNYYRVTPSLRFPYYSMPQDEDKFLYGTILDGELVNDEVPGKPDEKRLIFYVFDCLAIDGSNYTQRSLDKRIGAMKEKVFKPYDAWYRAHPEKMAADPFRVKEKQVYPPYHLTNMFTHVLPHLPHGNDGLIFTCKSTPYQFGTDQHILKWKPPHENTIDFKLRLGPFPLYDPEDGHEGLLEDYDAKPEFFQLLVLHNRNEYQPFQHKLQVTDAEWEMLKSLNERLDGRIIECYRDEQGRWRMKTEDDGTPRWRDDKKDANHITTVMSVLESIQDRVTEKDLCNAEAKIRDAVKRLQAEERLKASAMEQHVDKKRKFEEVNGSSSPAASVSEGQGPPQRVFTGTFTGMSQKVMTEGSKRVLSELRVLNLAGIKTPYRRGVKGKENRPPVILESRRGFGQEHLRVRGTMSKVQKKRYGLKRAG